MVLLLLSLLLTALPAARSLSLLAYCIAGGRDVSIVLLPRAAHKVDKLTICAVKGSSYRHAALYSKYTRMERRIPHGDALYRAVERKQRDEPSYIGLLVTLKGKDVTRSCGQSGQMCAASVSQLEPRK